MGRRVRLQGLQGRQRAVQYPGRVREHGFALAGPSSRDHVPGSPHVLDPVCTSYGTRVRRSFSRTRNSPKSWNTGLWARAVDFVDLDYHNVIVGTAQANPGFVCGVYRGALFSAALGQGRWCANEAGNCTCAGGKVRFGLGNIWSVYKAVKSHVVCSSQAFFDNPLPGPSKPTCSVWRLGLCGARS